MPIGDIYAPEFPKTAIWLNSKKPLNLSLLKGQVCLLDFWTYCCINCIHVFPDLEYLENKYKNDPFLVIGVHTAKFFNERNIENIESAIERYGLKHPVIVDNNHIIWESYGISAWPSFVLIDSQGRIRGSVSGEGRRLQLDIAIRELLEEGKKEGTLAQKPLDVVEKKIPRATTLSFPGKIALDHRGERIFISDSNHNRILVCHFHTPFEAHIIESIGSGEEGAEDGSFNKVSFRYPQGIHFLNEFLYVCDTDNHSLRRIDLKEKIVQTEIKDLNSPWDLDYADGYLYLAMAGSHQIFSYQIATRDLKLFAGSGIEGLFDGDLLSAQLAQPSGISIFENRIYFLDSESSALREIDLNSGELTTLIGKGLFDFGFQDGDFSVALLQHPVGLFATKDKIFIADTYNHALRLADLKNRRLSTLFRLGEEFCFGDKSCEILPLHEPNDIYLIEKFLYLADTNNHLIRIFDLESRELKILNLTDIPKTVFF